MSSNKIIVLNMLPAVLGMIDLDKISHMNKFLIALICVFVVVAIWFYVYKYTNFVFNCTGSEFSANQGILYLKESETWQPITGHIITITIDGKRHFETALTEVTASISNPNYNQIIVTNNTGINNISAGQQVFISYSQCACM